MSELGTLVEDVTVNVDVALLRKQRDYLLGLVDDESEHLTGLTSLLDAMLDKAEGVNLPNSGIPKYRIGQKVVFQLRGIIEGEDVSVAMEGVVVSVAMKSGDTPRSAKFEYGIAKKHPLDPDSEVQMGDLDERWVREEADLESSVEPTKKKST